MLSTLLGEEHYLDTEKICQQSGSDTHLSLLLVEVVDDDADKEVEGEEGTEDDEDDKVQVHVQVHFLDRLLLHLDTHAHTQNIRKL